MIFPIHQQHQTRDPFEKKSLAIVASLKILRTHLGNMIALSLSLFLSKDHTITTNIHKTVTIWYIIAYMPYAHVTPQLIFLWCCFYRSVKPQNIIFSSGWCGSFSTDEVWPVAVVMDFSNFTPWLGGLIHIFLFEFSPWSLGFYDPIYFSNGLVQPPTRWRIYQFTPIMFLCFVCQILVEYWVSDSTWIKTWFKLMNDQKCLWRNVYTPRSLT